MGLRTIQTSGAVDELEVGGRRRLSRIAEVAERLRPRRGIDAEVIVQEMLRHFPHGDAELVRRAFEYGAEAHKDQRRASGGPYIEHPANTAYLFAPLAHRPGIWQVKWELEDLAFKHLDAVRYKELAERLASKRAEREKRIKDAMEVLSKELTKAGIRAELSGRAKHIYSIWRKMQRKGVDLDEIYDLLAVRVVVDEVPECYAALGVIHTLWPPIPG